MHEYPYRTCAEIDLNKLQRNLQRLRALIGPDCRIMEVMKADAYGHGLRVCAEYAAPYVDWFAAATLEEALAVRAAAPHTPILIFGGLLDPEIIQAAQHGLTINVFSLQYASHVQALLQPMGLHADVHMQGRHRHEPARAPRPAGHCAQAVSDAARICALCYHGYGNVRERKHASLWQPTSLTISRRRAPTTGERGLFEFESDARAGTKATPTTHG